MNDKKPKCKFCTHDLQARRFWVWIDDGNGLMHAEVRDGWECRNRICSLWDVVVTGDESSEMLHELASYAKFQRRHMNTLAKWDEKDGLRWTREDDD